MIQSRVFMLAVLALAVILSAIGVVHAKYLTRVNFSHLQDLRTQRDAIDVEWNRLRLEEATLTTHARVERKARYELGMFAPRMGDVLLIEEAGHGNP